MHLSFCSQNLEVIASRWVYCVTVCRLAPSINSAQSSSTEGLFNFLHVWRAGRSLECIPRSYSRKHPDWFLSLHLFPSLSLVFRYSLATILEVHIILRTHGKWIRILLLQADEILINLEHLIFFPISDYEWSIPYLMFYIIYKCIDSKQICHKMISLSPYLSIRL